MSELPISSKYRSRPDVPVDDEERDQLSTRLNAAYTSGSLESEDYHGRLDRLFAAQTLGELVPVVEGLPPAETYQQPGIVAQQDGGRPGELTSAKSGTRAAAVITASVAAAVLLILILLVVFVMI